jgi:eukaryotic-like serine/threonine-protein kinase
VGDTTVATLMARVGTLLPEHPALGPLNEVLVWAAAPDADERYDAAAFGIRLKALAAHLPEPGPLPLIEPVPLEDAGAKVDLDKALVWPTRQAPAPGPEETTELGLSDTKTQLVAATTAAGGGADPPMKTGRRRRWPWVVAAAVIVVALVAGGLAVAAHRGLFTPSHPIPSLVGKTVPAAVKATTADHFSVHQSGAEYSITVATGLIISQLPTTRSGGKATMAKQGAVISVVVSKGLPSVAIPSNLATYSTCGDATKALATIHLVGVCPATAEQYNPTVPAGGVLGSTPTGTAPYGSTVTIITSKGHAPVPVPVVTGAGTTYAAAAAAITAGGLVPAQSQTYSSTVPSGQVIASSPASGTQVAFGSTVTVTVSQGPKPVTIPPLIGQSLSSAVSALQALGLKVASYGPGSSGIVVYASPSAGTSVLPGTTVTVDFV